jgi:hypothetical protein
MLEVSRSFAIQAATRRDLLAKRAIFIGVSATGPVETAIL